jgi:small-conductance mechanosensitive channel
LLALWILLLTILSSRLAGTLIRFHGSGIPGALPVTTLTQTLAQLAVVILGVLVLLNLWGVSITPILTALGVGGLAVALALQDTLSNLFAGFYVAVAGQVRLGDYIRLNTGEEGYVTDIGWRSTSIRALANNMIIIPNSKLGQANVTNFYLPEKRVAASIQVGVAYDSDPDQVVRVLLEEAQTAAREVPGLLAEPAPDVTFDPGFGDSSLGFTLGYSVQEFAVQFPVRHELRKRILKRLRKEKIDMPFPTRTIYVHGQKDS